MAKKKVVNHPPTPVAESPTQPGAGEVDCEALKAKYGVNVDTFTKQKKTRKKGQHRHHILQNACVTDYISKGEGLCIALANSRRGSAHQATTARQNKRRDNKKGGRRGTKPAKTVGGLKKLSKEDLNESFKKMNIPEPDRSNLADCLVEEADRKMKKAAKLDKKKTVTDRSSVKQPGGCFPAGTLVWLDAHTRRRIERVAAGDRIQGGGGTRVVVRRDWCVSDLVRLRLPHETVTVAPFHRIRLADGRYRRADALGAGTTVCVDGGVVSIVGIEAAPIPRRVYRVGVGLPFECRIGRVGLWVELPHTGVPVAHVVRLARFTASTINRRRSAGRGSGHR